MLARNDTDKSYLWVLFAIGFFLLYRFFLVFLLWDGRLIPPLPSDSAHIITSIRDAIDGKPFLRLPYPTYDFLLGLSAKILNMAPEKIFRASHYVFPLVGLTAVYFATRSMGLRKCEQGLSICISAFTPIFSFPVANQYSVVYFFILVGYVLCACNNSLGWKKVIRLLLLFVLVFGFVFFHRSAIYYAAIFMIMFFVVLVEKYLFKVSVGSIPSRLLILILFTVVSYGCGSYLLSTPCPNVTVTPISIRAVMPDVSSGVRVSWSNFVKNLTGLGFRYFLLMIVPFLTFFWSKTFLVLRRYLHLRRVIIASVVFLVVSFFHEQGNRALFPLYLITFILAGVVLSRVTCENTFSKKSFLSIAVACILMLLPITYEVMGTLRLNYLVNIGIDYSKNINDVPYIEDGYFFVSDPWLVQSYMESKGVDSVLVGSHVKYDKGNIIVVLDTSSTYFFEDQDRLFYKIKRLIHSFGKKWLIDFTSTGIPHPSLRYTPAERIQHIKNVNNGIEVEFLQRNMPFYYYLITKSPNHD